MQGRTSLASGLFENGPHKPQVCYAYRPELWFWNSVVLVLTLALAASLVFATALDTYFQLAIMLMILMMGLTALAHFRPFTNNLLQRMQVYFTSSRDTTASLCLSA